MARKSKATARNERRDRRRPAKINLVVDNDAPVVPVRRMRQSIEPLNAAQRAYDVAITSRQLVFGTGPAGTGKTWFATMRAAEALDRGEIERIIITRPALEAGERLGFLPGELEEKYEPFLRPVQDALEEFFGTGKLEYLLKKKVIDPRPLAYIRGSTLKNCWAILDEAQNTTVAQMKLFLTRIGEGSKFIVNGDIRQSDLPAGITSGLADAIQRFDGLSSVATVRFAMDDIVRSGLCREIVSRYEQ